MSAGVDVPKLLSGDRRELARAITLAEDSREGQATKAQALIDAALPHSGKSLRVAVTGIPGAGKSTFIEALGMYLVGLGKKVAVLAIDPSGPNSGGSILGDKTRMEKLSVHPNAFVRPSPSGGVLGGVARRTREAIILCEASGYDVVLVETVGVGQSEFEVAHLVDVVSLLLTPFTGDELQGIKRGIMEVADVIVVNKADGALLKEAEVAQNHIRSALGLFSHAADVPVLLASAMAGTGLAEAWEALEKASKALPLKEKRAQQEKRWFKRLVWDGLERKIAADGKLTKEWAALEAQVADKRLGAHAAAARFIDLLLG